MPIKRLHYFDHQFLVQADFADEQQYHLDMRRRLNRLLHTVGIAEGLEVVKHDNKTVTVRRGMAIDGLGREMIVEADQVVDLSQFRAGAAIFITIVYHEQGSDPTTATGVSGNTRITEQPLIQAVTTTPPTDGTVIPLASFTLDSSANVPGNSNDPLDDGVRRKIGPQGERLASLNGVSNPAGGNVDLVRPQGQAQAISIVPDAANHQIVISENHSTQTGNVHGLIAKDLQQIGALLASDYDLGKRALKSVVFTEQDGKDGTGAPRTVPFGFRPRLVLVVGSCKTRLGTNNREYGGSVTGFADLTGDIQNQRSSCFGLIRLSNTDWFSQVTAVDGTICRTTITNAEAGSTTQSETLVVAITSVSATGLIATLTRLINVGSFPNLPNFTILLNLLAMG